jgi:YHS domain-containing protein
MKTLIVVLLVIINVAVLAQSDGVRVKHFNIKRNVAIDGYDPVSYFEGKAQEGKDNLFYSHKGITYLFANNNNLAKFKASPEKFEPAYGGWCAYAMGNTGEKVKVDPETFKIVNGKLYLFYNFWGNNTLEDWNENEKKLKEAADKNWVTLLK